MQCVIEPDVALGEVAFERNGISIYECPSCGTFVADSGYDDAQYDEDYYTLASDDVADIEQRWGFRARYILDGVVAEMGRGVSLLDVGAGNGFFVKVAAEEFGLAATGIEIAKASTDFARDVLGVELITGDINDHDEQYDVVTSLSVIEHVEDPVGMVEALKQRVRPGGLLVLATPNPDCIQRRVKGKKKWAMICPPHHLNVMTVEGVDRLVESAGFTVVRREAISTYVKAVKDIDTESQLLRRAAFQALRVSKLGADQLVYARLPA